MPIIVSCECGQQFEVSDVRCPVCGREPIVPQVAAITAGNAVRRKVITVLVLGVAAFFCCVFLLMPAVATSLEAGRRSQCVLNLKQIALAMHTYLGASSAQDNFPPAAIVDEVGKPLLSWRVTILPFVGEQVLFNEFHLNEPWDSPHNKALLPRMPSVYRCRSEPSGDPSLTNYQVIVGPHTMFEKGKVVTFREITDGASQTIMVAESKDLVPWTKPEDLVFDPYGPLPAFGSRHPLGFNVALADGAVRFLKSSIRPEILKGAITRDEGEVLSSGCY